MPTYRYGSFPPNHNVPAQIVGETLEQIRERNGGTLTPKLVVEAARPDDSPIHDAITWHIETAAGKWQEWEARNLIRCIEIDNPNLKTRPSEIAYISIGNHEDGSLYASSRDVLTDAERRQHAINDVIRQMRGLQQRFDHYEELQGLWAELDRIAFDQAARVAPKPKPRAQAKPAAVPGRPR